MQKVSFKLSSVHVKTNSLRLHMKPLCIYTLQQHRSPNTSCNLCILPRNSSSSISFTLFAKNLTILKANLACHCVGYICLQHINKSAARTQRCSQWWLTRVTLVDGIITWWTHWSWRDNHFIDASFATRIGKEKDYLKFYGFATCQRLCYDTCYHRHACPNTEWRIHQQYHYLDWNNTLLICRYNFLSCNALTLKQIKMVVGVRHLAISYKVCVDSFYRTNRKFYRINFVKQIIEALSSLEPEMRICNHRDTTTLATIHPRQAP